MLHIILLLKVLPLKGALKDPYYKFTAGDLITIVQYIRLFHAKQPAGVIKT